jgi:DNA repair protein RadC
VTSKTTTPVFPNSIPEFTLSLKMKQTPSELFTVKTSADCADVMREVFDADHIEWVEEFVVIALSRSNKVMGFYKVSQGGISGTVADTRVIMQFALLSNACSIIIAHNHPSGNLKPSRQDEELTNKIRHAGNILDIKVLDHIILTSEGYYSFLDNGLM